MNYSFAQRVFDVPDSGIGHMMKYASAHPDVISLGQGTPQFPTPEFIYDYVRERARRDPTLGMYATPSIENELKDLIIPEAGRLYGFTPTREEIYLTAGGIGALFSTLMSVLEKDDEIVYFDPSYPLHLSQIHLTQAKPIFISLVEEKGWSIDLEKLRRSITPQTKAVILTNPNNPTGTVLSKSEVERLAQVVLEHQLLLILDEAYDFLTFETEIFSPMRIEALRPRTIVCKSFSKEFALTGWRIGYALADPKVIKKIDAVHKHFNISPSTVAVAAGIAALSDPKGVAARERFVQKFKESRETICRRLSRLDCLFSHQKPKGAYYVFPKILGFENLSTLDFAKLLVDEARVTTIPGSSMGPSGNHHLRLSFAAESDLIETAFDRLDEFAKKKRLL